VLIASGDRQLSDLRIERFMRGIMLAARPRWAR